MPKSVFSYYKYIINFYGNNIKPEQKSIPFNINIVSRNTLSEGNIIIKTRPVNHTKDSVAFRFEHNHTSVVYTGDTGISLPLINFAKNCTLLITECSFPTSRKAAGHMSPQDIKTLISKARPKKTIITHIYPGWRAEEIKELESLASENCLLAEDFKQFKI
ncbi:MAG: MBL fold metallo-hydrolase [Actinomycetota bacterium]